MCLQALFWDAPRVLDDTIIIAFNTVTWLTVLMIIVFIFKVMYFNDDFVRTQHERGNAMYVCLNNISNILQWFPIQIAHNIRNVVQTDKVVRK